MLKVGTSITLALRTFKPNYDFSILFVFKLGGGTGQMDRWARAVMQPIRTWQE